MLAAPPGVLVCRLGCGADVVPWHLNPRGPLDGIMCRTSDAMGVGCTGSTLFGTVDQRAHERGTTTAVGFCMPARHASSALCEHCHMVMLPT
jgi:hypothetical protein